MDSRRDSGITEFTTGRRETASTGPLRGYGDLALVVLLALLTVGAALLFGRRGGPPLVRVPLGLLFVFVLPGYALTAALFPGTEVGHPTASFSVTPVERAVLSVGLSLTTVPLISIGLTLFSYAIDLYSVLFAIAAFTVSSALVAAVRTNRTPQSERAGLPTGWLRIPDGKTPAWNRVDVAFALVLLLASAGLTAAIVGAESGDTYSELAIQNLNEDGEPTVDTYPGSLSLGESETLLVEIENREQRTVQYTVVVLLEEIDSDGGVVGRTELDRFDADLAHTERADIEHDVEPDRTGDSLRVSYLLYAGQVPDRPTMSNADQSVHFFADVTDES